MKHATDLIDRYGDRIHTWQIINERRQQNHISPIFTLFRQRLPDAALGVSHCARAYSDRPQGPQRDKDLFRGLLSIEQIESTGHKVDFFGAHVHRPEGLWADPRVMYELFDRFAAKGIRVHITETGINHSGKITGDVLEGVWDEDLQAEYIVHFLKICYSHPNVDVVNFWGFGPRTWQKNIGLLRKDFSKRPAFDALKQLVTEEWTSNMDSQS